MVLMPVLLAQAQAHAPQPAAAGRTTVVLVFFVLMQLLQHLPKLAAASAAQLAALLLLHAHVAKRMQREALQDAAVWSVAGAAVQVRLLLLQPVRSRGR